MGVEITDVRATAEREGERANGFPLFLTKRLHAWIYYSSTPGQKNKMHCHSRDETFFCAEGECTMHFPDGGTKVIKPGMLASVTGGTFYYLENTGDGPMMMVGNGSGDRKTSAKIDYETRKSTRGGA